jgi:pyruvate/2-oxoglutarate dehydrogenase complex dihydrolipoamide dehydrogenase (E3) component
VNQPDSLVVIGAGVIGVASAGVHVFLFLRIRRLFKRKETERPDDCVRSIADWTLKNSFSKHVWTAKFNTGDRFDGQEVEVVAELITNEEEDEEVAQ